MACLPLLALPVEIRLNIFNLLFPPRTQTFAAEHHNLCASGHHWSRNFDDSSLNEWLIYMLKTKSRLVWLPNTVAPLVVFDDGVPDTGILHTNRQMYFEAAQVLYRNTTFDFTHALHMVTPFFQNLRPWSRKAIQRLNFSPDLECGPCEEAGFLWTTTCLYVQEHLTLRVLGVKFTYRAGRRWSADRWLEKLVGDDALNLQDMLSADGDGSTAELVVSVQPRTATRECQSFLETLPIESLEEQRLILERNGEEHVHPVIKGLLELNGLESLDLKLFGGLSDEVRSEVQSFLRGEMLGKSSNER